MKRHGERIKHPKLRGEWTELYFMMRAAEEGISISKPWGGVTHYDFVVEAPGQFWRVQVKSTMFKSGSGYLCRIVGSGGTPYEDDAFDFVAAYVIPEDVWYIIPAKRIRGQQSIYLYSDLKRLRHERYREAWHLLRGGATVDAIDACADEGPAIALDSSMLVCLREELEVLRLRENLTL
jgi:hypothetical protein